MSHILAQRPTLETRSSNLPNSVTRLHAAVRSALGLRLCAARPADRRALGPRSSARVRRVVCEPMQWPLPGSASGLSYCIADDSLTSELGRPGPDPHPVPRIGGGGSAIGIAGIAGPNGLLHDTFVHLRYIWLKKIGRTDGADVPHSTHCPNHRVIQRRCPVPTEARNGCPGLVSCVWDCG